ncbi:MAG: LacI family DNA-binding transcriptional regulator [Pseudomonadota bacterium]
MATKTKNGKVTLADVAKEAGVSPMTASRVINGDQKVKSTTREKVQGVIERLKYAPNVAARNLAGANPLRICLLYGNPSSAFLGELLMGALSAASELGVQLLVEKTDDTVTPHEISLNMNTYWDGLIVPSPISEMPGLRKMIADRNFPTAFIASGAEPGRGHEIRINDDAAAFDVTKMLLEKGHRDIAFIKGHPTQIASEKRFLGYQRALNEFGLRTDPKNVEQGFFTYRSGLDAAEVFLNRDRRPTAIFASNDDMAAGAMAAAARHRLSVPKDLSIVGFDDSPIASTVWPNLTTVRQPIADMAASGIALVNRLGRRQKVKQAEFETITLPYNIIERETVSVPLNQRR